MSLLSTIKKESLPDSWDLKNIGAILNNSQYGTNEASVDNGNMQIVGMKDIQDGKILTNNLTKANLTKADREKFALNKGDILINRTNSYDLVGKVGLYNSDKVVGFASYLVRLSVNRKKADSVYINLWLNSYVAQGVIKRIATRAVSQANINPTEFKKLCPVPLPTLPEQKAIANLLSTWDEAIEKTERLIQVKKQFKIGRLQELITNNKANSTIGAFAKPIIRKVTKPSEPYVALGIRSHFKGTFQRNVEDPNSLSMDTLYKVQKDDLIVNITFAWEGAIALVKEDDEKCYVSHRFPTYRIIQEKAEASFVRQLILSSRIKYDLSNISPGGAGRNRVLNKKDFLKMPIWVPNLKKQKNIGELLATLDQEINLLKHLAEKYKTQKRGLMQKLLTGEWRIKPEILNNYKEA